MLTIVWIKFEIFEVRDNFDTIYDLSNELY